MATFHPPFDAGLRNLTAGTQQLTYQLYAPALSRYDRVIVFAELPADVLARLGVREDRLAVCPNGVDTTQWRPADALPSAIGSQLQRVRSRLGTERVFLYMGRISTEKNVEALLQAWRLVDTAGCRLVIVGDGPLRTTLQNSYGQMDNVLWWGYESDLSTRVALLQSAEVFLLPSLVEGLSLALLEAMASGCACVATDAGADGEVLAGGAGIVMNTLGVTSQLRTLLPVLRDQPVLTQALGRQARERVMERYTWLGTSMRWKPSTENSPAPHLWRLSARTCHVPWQPELLRSGRPQAGLLQLAHCSHGGAPGEPTMSFSWAGCRSVVAAGPPSRRVCAAPGDAPGHGEAPLPPPQPPGPQRSKPHRRDLMRSTPKRHPAATPAVPTPR